MGYIFAGLVLWTFAHGFRRFLPQLRESMGNSGKGLVTLGSLVAIGLMVLGYRIGTPIVLWSPPGWLYPVNNVLMLAAVYLFAVGGAKTRLSRSMRHPMLNGLKVWGLAHILVSGDAEGLLLFGGMIFWAYLAAALINRSDPWVIPDRSPIGKEIGVLITTAIVYAVIVFVHGWVGPAALWPGWPTDTVFGASLPTAN